MPSPAVSVNVGALNTTVQAAVRAMFWGAIALAVLLPIGAAAGGWVAGEIEKSGKEGKKIK